MFGNCTLVIINLPRKLRVEAELGAFSRLYPDMNVHFEVSSVFIHCSIE